VTARAKTLDRRTTGEAAIILRCRGQSWEKGDGQGFCVRGVIGSNRSKRQKLGEM
jgi:hypothetical protein